MVEHHGDLTTHMALHILAMNLLAPLLIYVWYRVSRHRPFLSAGIAVSTGLQIAFLWMWHIPTVLAAAASSALLSVLMHVSLLLSALLFWGAIFNGAARSPWQPICGLLVTGKLFCLLGILLLFAPRPLYWSVGHGTVMSPENQLADQQMAGLLMLVVCPLTYVLAGILVACRWLISTERSPGWRFDKVKP